MQQNAHSKANNVQIVERLQQRNNKTLTQKYEHPQSLDRASDAGHFGC